MRFVIIFFALNIRPGPHMNRQKRIHELFCFREHICEKPVSARSTTMLIADIVSAKSTTTLTLCQRSQQLPGHVSA